MKLLGVGVVALVGILSTMGFSRSEAASAPMTARPADAPRAVDVDAKDLAFDYLEERSANAKWQTRRVNVVGIVDEVVVLKDGRAVVLLRPSRGPQIMASTSDVDAARALGPGDRVALEGCTVAGKIDRVGLVGCKL